MMSTAATTQSFTDSLRRTAGAAVSHVDGYVIVTADGEIDASNADAFVTYVLPHLDGPTPLVVDLTRLKFLATAGVSTLHNMNTRCADNKARWAVAAGGAVARILRICDPEGVLPVVTTVASAKRLIGGDVELLELIPEPGQRAGEQP